MNCRKLPRNRAFPKVSIFPAIAFVANNYRGDLLEFVIAFTIATGMGVGAICGEISAIVAVMTKSSINADTLADDTTSCLTRGKLLLGVSGA